MIPKFRAWNKEHNEMVYPDDVDKIYFEITVDCIDTYNMRHVLPYDDKPPYLDTVVMQSTGLHDKNGKEIYEGDIVKNSYGEIGHIKHSIYTFVFAKKKESEWREFYLHGIGAGRPFEIIGNIHEHSHLLEDGGIRE